MLCDVFLPDGNGVDMIKKLNEAQPGCEVVLLTAHGNIADGVQALLPVSPATRKDCLGWRQGHAVSRQDR